MPALLNSRSMRPKRSIAAATAALTAASSRTSATAIRHAAPAASHSRRERLELGRGAHAVAGVRERRGDVERGDVVAVGRERERHRAALAVRGAGDEGDRALAHAVAPRYGSR